MLLELLVLVTTASALPSGQFLEPTIIDIRNAGQLHADFEIYSAANLWHSKLELNRRFIDVNQQFKDRSRKENASSERTLKKYGGITEDKVVVTNKGVTKQENDDYTTTVKSDFELNSSNNEFYTNTTIASVLKINTNIPSENINNNHSNSTEKVVRNDTSYKVNDRKYLKTKKAEDDVWVWSGDETTLMGTTVPPTPDTLDDRAAFTGDDCPTGKVKVKVNTSSSMCVDED